jgi:hypothetical protein
MNLNKLKFPIGEFYTPESYNDSEINDWIKTISEFPGQLEDITKKLGEKELSWKYRPNGWSIRQVVHHCADSHMNAIIRVKLTLTEENPAIRPYFEDRWSKLIDSNSSDIHPSISILKGVHKKLVDLLRNLSDEDLLKVYIHPEHNRSFELREVIANYAWHSKHHLEHVKQALRACGAYNK